MDPLTFLHGYMTNVKHPGIEVYKSMIACIIENHIGEVKDALKLNKKIVLNAYPEGWYHVEKNQDLMINLFKEHNRDISDLVILTGTMDETLINGSKLKDNYCYGPFISDWIKNDGKNLGRLTHDVSKKTKTFLCLNRVVRPGRVAIVAEMLKRDLLKNSYVSFFKEGAHFGRNAPYFPDVLSAFEPTRKEEYLKLIDSLPDNTYADDINPNENQAATTSPFELYETSFFNITTESFWAEKDFFPSEKIYKPILHEQPFIVVSTYRFLHHLRKQGFQTFGKWFNESYDEMEDINERMEALATELERLDKLPIETKRQMVTEMKPILEHNRNVFLDKDFLLKTSHIDPLINLIEGEVEYTIHESVGSSFIDPTKINDNCILLDGYQMDEMQRQITNNINSEKKLILDFSKEFVAENIFPFLAKFPDLSNVCIVALQSKHTDAHQETCTAKGLQIHYDQHFIENRFVYRPVSANISPPPENKIYTLHTGKTKQHRTALIGLLSYYDLLKYGHVSFFGDTISSNFDNHKIADFYNAGAPQELQDKVTQGLNKIQLPLLLDTDEFTFNIAHELNFVRDHFDACKFVVVVESNYANSHEVPALTEKVVKPIAVDKKFMILGQQGYTETLKSTLHKKEAWDGARWDSLTSWCDYKKYDNEADGWKRLELFVEELKIQIQKEL